MNKKRKQNVARIMAFVMMFVTVFQSVGLTTFAAGNNKTVSGNESTDGGSKNKETNPETVSSGNIPTVSGNNGTKGTFDTGEGKVWHMKSATGHGNQRPDQTTGKKAFVALWDDSTSITNDSFSVTIKMMSEMSDTRGYIVNKYVSESENSLIGFNPTGWFVQVGEKYTNLGSLTKPNKGETFTIKGEWQANGKMLLTLANSTSGKTDTQEVGLDEFNALKDKSGKFGLMAGTWEGAALTELLFWDMKAGDKLYTGEWKSLYADVTGQILQEYVEPAPEPKKWQIKSSENHGNGEMKAGTGASFFALSDASSVGAEDFSVTFMPTLATNRMGFLNKYVDNDNWSYIGYNPANWYLQWNDSWLDISKDKIPLPEAYDYVTVKGEWQQDALKITVINTTKNTTNSITVNSTDKSSEGKSMAGFLNLKSQTGQFGFRAGSYKGSADAVKALTEYYVDSVMIGDKIYTGELSVLGGDAKGGICQAVERFPSKPVTGDGKKWYVLTGGPKNGGGHAYGNADVSAPVTAVDWDKTMPVDGTLSLKFKPMGDAINFGIFYTYVDDSNWLYVGYDSSSKWYYQFKHNGKDSYPGLGNLPTPVKGEELDMSISISNETLKVVVNGIEATTPNPAVKDFMEDSKVAGKGRFGVKTNGNNNPVSFTDVKINGADCMDDNWNFLVDRTGQKFETVFMKLVNVSGTITDKTTKAPLAGATVRIGSQSATTGQDGKYTLEKVQEGNYRVSASMKDYISVSDTVTIGQTDMTGLDFELLSKGAIDLTKYNYIQSSDMKVYIAKNFPRILRYVQGDKTIFNAQETEIDSFTLNGKKVTPVVTTNADFRDGTDNITYTLAVKDEAAKLNLEMDVKVSVENMNLTWEVTAIRKAADCAKIGTIDFSNLNLVTIDAYADNGEFMGAKKSTHTLTSGDHRVTFADNFVPNDQAGYLYAFLSGDSISAGLFSNSEAEGDQRVIRSNGADIISLNSAPFYYELGDKGGQGYKTASTGYRTSQLPVIKICLTGNRNSDSKVDWQDGAIAYRSIMNNPMGNETTKDMVNTRIVMNFSSSAPNPYLETADNIKKIYLATDGLPQSVMLKGYGNEGHDSANSEYADIAEREGGVDDFKKLIEIAHKYNTEIGIHINAQEAYPEAASFNEAMVGGGPTYGNGWGWLDQSHVIDKLWDLQTEARYKRLIQLYDRINNTDFYSKKWDVNDKKGSAVGESQGEIRAAMEDIRKDAANRPDNMDFIYLDVWYQNSWETRRVAEEINSLGWRFTTEFSDQGEYDSTWQHWATDAKYGGAAMKGFNSDVIRFIRNHQRDSQVLNHPEFGGTADNPLLGGYRLWGFEGWGGDQNYTNYIYNTYKDNLPTRFLQHYEVTDWEKYGEDETSPTGNTEKKITLKNGSDVVVVTREEAQRADNEIERTITLNNRTVLQTTVDHFYYLLPWTDEDGSEKLYHWNKDGGTSPWQLPDDWNGAVYMYKLTDQGRVQGQTLTVNNGSLTINAEAGVPYVLVKAEGVKTLAMGFGEGDYVEDPGFNGYADQTPLNGVDWKGDLSSFIVETGVRGDQYVKVGNSDKEVSASTTISGLVPGQYYVAEIYVENQSDAKAWLEIQNGSQKLSNFTVKSIAQNYIQSDEQHTTGSNPSYMQHIQISFKAEKKTATFTLKREAGEGITKWDDIRIVEKKIDNYKADGSFVQDFESVVQGVYPFVIGSAQGVTDHVTHLSEKNAPFTQTGWNGRVIDDVIGGQWSLKHHGSNNGIIYQTIPQNFRFEEGKYYQVTFDYQTGSGGAYAMVVGNGTTYTKPASYLESSVGKGTQTVTMRVSGEEGGQTWIGLYCNGATQEGPMGQCDFNLDNLKIVEEKDAVIIKVPGGKTDLLKGESVQLTASNSQGAAWTSDNEEAVTVDSTGFVKAVGDGTAVITVTATHGKSDSVTFTSKSSIMSQIRPVAAVANTEETAGEDGGAVNVFDNDGGTLWHSQWSGNGFTVSEANPAIITVDLGQETEISSFFFKQRASGGVNGLVNKYQWAVGNAFDEASNEITDGTLSAVINVAEAKNGAEEVISVTGGKIRYLQIRVTEGKNGFAAIAEIAGLTEQKVATKIELNKSAAEVEEGKSITLSAIATEGNIVVQPVWTSADPSIATVENGVVKGIKLGETTITCTTGTGAAASCKVTVTEAVPEPPVTPEDAVRDLAEGLKDIDAQNPDRNQLVQDLLDKTILKTDFTQLEVISDEMLKDLEAAENQIIRILGSRTDITNSTGLDGFRVNNALLSVPAGKNAEIRISEDNVPGYSDGNKKLENARAYSFNLFCDNSPASIKAPVVLTLPIHEQIDTAKAIVVLHYKDGVLVEKLAVSDMGGFVQVTVKGFSTFVLANEVEAGENPGPGPDPTPTPTPTPDPGPGSGSGDNGTGTKPDDKKPANVKSPKTYDSSVASRNEKPDESKADDQSADVVTATAKAPANMAPFLIVLCVMAALGGGIGFYFKWKHKDE